MVGHRCKYLQKYQQTGGTYTTCKKGPKMVLAALHGTGCTGLLPGIWLLAGCTGCTGCMERRGPPTASLFPWALLTVL